MITSNEAVQKLTGVSRTLPIFVLHMLHTLAHLQLLPFLDFSRNCTPSSFRHRFGCKSQMLVSGAAAAVEQLGGAPSVECHCELTTKVRLSLKPFTQS